MRYIYTECTQCKKKLIHKGVNNTQENRTNEKPLKINLNYSNHKQTKLNLNSVAWVLLIPMSDRRLSAKLVPTFEDKGCRVVSATESHGRILGFLDWSRNFFFRVAPLLYSRGSVVPVPDPLLLRKFGRAGNRTRTSGSVGRNSDH
jgi:hypothetical protein